MKNILFILWGLMLLTFACGQHTPPVIEPNPSIDSIECKEFVKIMEASGGYRDDYPEDLYRYPCFNPENRNEFLYQKVLTKQFRKNELRTHHLVSGENKLIQKDNYTTYAPKWGIEDWIIVNFTNRVYRLKINGDSLKLLTPLGGVHPCWYGNTTNFVYLTFLDTTFGGGLRMLDINGNILKHTPPFCDAKLDVSIHSQKVGYGFPINEPSGFMYHEIRVRDFDNLAYQTVFRVRTDNEAGRRQEITSLKWNPINENELFWTCIDGIFKVNIQTLKVVKIKDGCDSKRYSSIDISPDGAKVLVQREDNYQMDDIVTIKRYNHIYLMNIDGTNEQKIELP